MAGVMLPALSSVLQPALLPVLGPPMRGGGGDPLLEAIRALFANGEQGALYYFTEDFAGLYQDAAGTTPVTAVGQPVGLMLDRRFGLERGEELLLNPNFTGVPEWILGPGWSLTPDGLLHTSAGQSGNDIVYGETSTAGLELPNTDLDILDGYATTMLRESTGRIFEVGLSLEVDSGTSLRLRSSGTQLSITARLAIPFDGLVKSSSLREILGSHASQTTTTARPTLRSGPLRIDYDGVDDYLRTVFPDLGGDVTIARSIPGVGAQILTGQTIAAGNWDDNVTSCATLVIDRALTGPETALVTAFLNQQAGV